MEGRGDIGREVEVKDESSNSGKLRKEKRAYEWRGVQIEGRAERVMVIKSIHNEKRMMCSAGHVDGRH